MDKVIVIRFGEIYLKGKNRNYFEKQLVKNIKYKLFKFDCKFTFGRSRYLVENYNQQDEESIINSLKTVFGIHSLSVARLISSEYSKILDIAKEISSDKGSFRVNANRADKSYPLTSVQLAAKLGGDLLLAIPKLTVDLHKPDFVINVDVREGNIAFVYSDKVMGAGGMPVGCAGQGLLLLSGGIDSPVAGFMMAKRGMCLDALHFHSYPYTSDLAKEKVIELAKIMQTYCGKIKLYCVSATKIQEEIHKNCDESYMITILRRFMMLIAEKVALLKKCGCIVNGESLGQVASQTLESITLTNSMVKDLPVFRPLIGMDKQEIIDISERIGTYSTSILPYEDCCTVFLPENPATRPSLCKVLLEEQKIKNYNELIEEAIANLEIINMNP